MFELIMLGLMLFVGLAVLPLIYIAVEEIRRCRYWKRRNRCKQAVERARELETEKKVG